MANTVTKNATKKPATPKKGAAYTFSGDYYCKCENGLRVKAYSLEVVFPELLSNPLATFKKCVSTVGNPIQSIMLKKYPDFNSVRTYNVLRLLNNTGSKSKKTDDISLMDIEQLKDYIADNDIDFDTKIYNDDVVKVREAIALFKTSPDKFKEAYEQAIKDFELNSKLADLNGVDDNTDTDESSMEDLLDDLDDKGNKEE